MAPNISASQQMEIRGTIEESSLTNQQIADVAKCSSRTVSTYRTNLKRFGSTKAPFNGQGGRPRSMADWMLKALLTLLSRKPCLQQDEMAIFIFDNFGETLSTSTIGRALRKAGWSKKVARRIAMEQCPDLRDMYLHDLSPFDKDHIVYVDETGRDNTAGFRRTGWSPLGVTPVQIARFQRGQRYHILPAFTSDGVLYAHICQGTTDGAVFEAFLEQLLPRCGRWPEPRSVLIMDNAVFVAGHEFRRCVTKQV